MGLFSKKQDQSEATTRPSRPSRARRPLLEDDPDPLDPAVLLRKRARRRVVGAIALALAAVIVLPMVIDSEPPSAGEDMTVVLPDKDTPFVGAKPLTKPAAGANSLVPGALAPPPPLAPANPSAESPSTGGPRADAGVNAAAAPLKSDDKSASATLPAAAAPIPGPVASPSLAPPKAAPVPGPAVGAPATPAKPASDNTITSKTATAKTADKSAGEKIAVAEKPARVDDPRAVAALEGRVPDAAPQTAAATPASGPAATSPAAKTGKLGPASGTFAVQIGVFANADKVKELLERLSGAGFKTYTEELETTQGVRTRVRIGPFKSRDDAQKAIARVKSMSLDGILVTP